MYNIFPFTGVDRLDKDLTIGQMQGEDGLRLMFVRLVVVDNCGSDGDCDNPLYIVPHSLWFYCNIF